MRWNETRLGLAGIWFLLLAWTLLLIAGYANAADARFSWLPNSEKDLAGYRIHYGSTPGKYSQVVDAGLPATQADGRVYYTVEGVSTEPTYFAATAYDKAGNESTFSNEEDVDLPPASVGSFSKVTVEVKVTVDNGGGQ